MSSCDDKTGLGTSKRLHSRRVCFEYDAMVIGHCIAWYVWDTTRQD